MPVRPRRTRNPRLELTLSRFMALTLGVDPEIDEPLKRLIEVFQEHRNRFQSGDWIVELLERGVDTRPGDGLVEVDAAETGCPGC